MILYFCWLTRVAIGVPEVHQHPITSVSEAAGIQNKEYEKETNLRRTVCVERNLTTHQQKQLISAPNRKADAGLVLSYLLAPHHASLSLSTSFNWTELKLLASTSNLGPTKSDLAAAADPFMYVYLHNYRKTRANFEIR
jgi:hypothetical protein